MPRIPVDVDAREYSEALKARGDQPWRKILLEALGVEESPRRLGRPPRVSSHAIGSDSSPTDHHVVQGLDTGLEQKKLMERMRKRARGV